MQSLFSAWLVTCRLLFSTLNKRDWKAASRNYELSLRWRKHTETLEHSHSLTNAVTFMKYKQIQNIQREKVTIYRGFVKQEIY